MVIMRIQTNISKISTPKFEQVIMSSFYFFKVIFFFFFSYFTNDVFFQKLQNKNYFLLKG